MKILNVQQMNEVDRLSTERHGIPSLLLMENAGIHLLRALEEVFGEELALQRILILCGKGNNGGDGLVLARQLAQRRIPRRVLLLGARAEVSGDAAVNLEIYLKSGGSVIEVPSPEAWEKQEGQLEACDVIVDALLGTGLSKPLRSPYREAVEAINRSPAFVLAVDVPTGMFSDSMGYSPLVVEADVTVTFTAPKIAHVLSPQLEALGRLQVVPIGSPSQLLENPTYNLNLMEAEGLANWLSPRPLDTHKGAMGKVAVVGGSRGKGGAPALAAIAALHSGSGLVTAVTPAGVQNLVASFQPDIMTEGLGAGDQPYFTEEDLAETLQLVAGLDAGALGPGLGRDPGSALFVRRLTRQSPLPLVLDADALNAFEGAPEELVNDRRLPLILTPHPGEFSRLTGRSLDEIADNRVQLAREFAATRGLWLVLKGFRTLVAEPGGQVFVCPLGNPGMATGGMGDALTGILLQQMGRLAAGGQAGSEAVTQAVQLGVYLHSAAGDLAAQAVGPEQLTASTLIEFIGEAYQELSESNAIPF